MKKLQVKILIGVPASGKSTWSLDFVRRNPDWVRVSRDDFRFMLKDQPICEPKIESLINTIQDSVILDSLAKGLNVIIDNTNLKKSYIEHFSELVEPYASVEFQVFDISLKKALERDEAREKKVGKEVLERMFKQYEILVDSFDPSGRPMKRKIYKNPILDPKLPNAVIFDMDGTLSHMVNRGPFDWDKVYRDDLDIIVARQLEMHKNNGDKILIVSGRDSSCKKETSEWLEMYGLGFDDIFMRKEGDYRKDSIIKEEIYLNHIKGKYNILIAYDDRNQVVDKWRELGIKCFQVNPGNF